MVDVGGNSIVEVEIGVGASKTIEVEMEKMMLSRGGSGCQRRHDIIQWRHLKRSFMVHVFSYTCSHADAPECLLVLALHSLCFCPRRLISLRFRPTLPALPAPGQ